MFYTGRQIGTYKLIKILGRGGFGEVWLAERQAKFVTTKVAVKLPLEEQVDADSIKQEAVLWEQASGHPNVLPIIDADEYDGQIVIVSEYAPDGTLDDLLRKEGALPIKKAVEMAVGILSGLDYLHNKKIIHRDIKPANILLQGDTPRLADFGMSRAMRGNSMSVNVNGTPFYMAPEAFNRKRNARTDIWSVGVVLYRMLKGDLPFQSLNLVDLMSEILTHQPEPLPDHIPEQLRQIVAKALAKVPENRYASAREMREELLDFQAVSSYENIRTGQQPPRRQQGQKNSGAVNPATPKAGESTPPKFPVSFLNSKELEVGTLSQIPRVTADPVEVQSVAAAQPVKKRRFRRKFLIYGAPLAALVALAAGFFFFFPKPDLVPYRKGDKFGFSDGRKRLFIGPRYDVAKPFSEGFAVVAVGMRDVQENFAGKYGFVDEWGREIIPLEYDYAEDFSEGLAKMKRFDAAQNKYLYGFINTSGAEIIPPRYDDALNYSPAGLAAVKSGGKWGFIDKTGNEIIPPKYDAANNFSGGLAAVKLKDKYGFIDTTGREAVPFVYDYAGNFSEDVAPVKKGDKTFFIDATGKEAIPFKYSKAHSFSERLAQVTINGKSGFIDKSGREAVPLAYEDEISAFSEGLADVKLNDKYGFIDKGGREVIAFKYVEADPFRKGFARVKNPDGKEFYIRFDGTEYYEP